jgi:hypothetical protein
MIEDRFIDLHLMRHKDGIKIGVHTAPEVEAFFEDASGGGKEGPTHGRLWKSIDGKPLELWTFDIKQPDEFIETSNLSLHHTGGPLTSNGIVNISFLRLVGASKGTEFLCDMVLGRSELEVIGKRLERAVERFCTEYIQKVHFNIYVGRRDLSHRTESYGI